MHGAASRRRNATNRAGRIPFVSTSLRRVLPLPPRPRGITSRRTTRTKAMGHRSRSRRAPPRRLLLNREHELSQLCRALDGALRGRGQIVLTAGEAGIGKTTLAQVIAARANTRGARVLWGRSGDLEGSPPYWPWAEALRALAEDRSTDVQALFAPRARYLSLVLPELRERFRFDRASVPDDESVRFHVADAVRAVLQRAARQRSILLVLEDMHWADQGSLFLLEFMAQEIRETSLLVLATYRDGEVAAPLAQMLGNSRDWACRSSC